MLVDAATPVPDARRHGWSFVCGYLYNIDACAYQTWSGAADRFAIM